MHFFCGLFSQQTTHLFSTFIKPSVATRDQKLLEISGLLVARATVSTAIWACDAQVGSGHLDADRCIACHSSELIRYVHAQVFSSGVAKPGAQHMHRAQRICWGFQPTMTPMIPITPMECNKKDSWECFKMLQATSKDAYWNAII